MAFRPEPAPATLQRQCFIIIPETQLVTQAPFTIVFILYPDFTQLDFAGPFEVFSHMPGGKMQLAAKNGGMLTSDTGLTYANLERLADIESCDMICIPGGSGQMAAMLDADFMAQVRRLGKSARYVTSVCTGSLILAGAGLLEGKRAACHWAFRDLLARFGVESDPARVVRDGNAITGGGVTAGIDFALTVVADLQGDAVAQSIQLFIEYAPAPPFNAGTPELAPPEIVAQIRAGAASYRQAHADALARFTA